jgi:predicted chitinase
LFERLETTPGQERVFLAASEQLKGSKQRIKEELERSRRDLAQVFRGEQFSQAAIREILARHEAILGELRETAIEALAKIDEALDERQRKLLADLIESGPRFRAGRTAPDRYI